ncbi:hypothetical protein L596_019019 [Steinernema carpocapsae]|uniref:Uncharacterized protein n=1 Tax=Steinernema carpocapsae TaxID=34508 RepID=A0A4V6XW52_STECR|nr:hypothetical protein L596_019019 [Steinernema carpocapsae]
MLCLPLNFGAEHASGRRFLVPKQALFKSFSLALEGFPCQYFPVLFVTDGTRCVAENVFRGRQQQQRWPVRQTLGPLPVQVVAFSHRALIKIAFPDK